MIRKWIYNVVKEATIQALLDVIGGIRELQHQQQQMAQLQQAYEAKVAADQAKVNHLENMTEREDVPFAKKLRDAHLG